MKLNYTKYNFKGNSFPGDSVVYTKLACGGMAPLVGELRGGGGGGGGEKRSYCSFINHGKVFCIELLNSG